MACPHTGPSKGPRLKKENMCYSGGVSRLIPPGIISVLCIGRTSFQIPSLTLCGPWEGQDMAPTPNRGGALRAHTRGGDACSQTYTQADQM